MKKKITNVCGIPIYYDEETKILTVKGVKKKNYKEAMEFARNEFTRCTGMVQVKVGEGYDGRVELFPPEEVKKRGWLPIGNGLYSSIIRKEAIRKGWYETNYGTWGYDPYSLC